jgi:hypothetical protein
VRRLLAVSLLVLFATLAMADAMACPDGCQEASSEATADQCDSPGMCVFCTGAVVAVEALVPIAPFITPLPASLPPVPAFPTLPAAVLDRPPRVS